MSAILFQASCINTWLFVHIWKVILCDRIDNVAFMVSNLQMHFLEWKFMNVAWYFIEVCS